MLMIRMMDPQVGTVAQIGWRAQELLGETFPAAIAAAPIPVDVYETADEFVVCAAVPGARSEDVQVELQGSALVIRANRLANLPEGAQVLVREVPSGEFTRVIEFPLPVEADGATASLADGDLTVHVPKAAEARARQITVKGVSA